MRARRFRVISAPNRGSVRRGSAIRAVWAPSRLRRILRHRLGRAALVIAVGVACTMSFAARTAALDDARASWAETESVAVMSQAAQPGDLVQLSVVMQDLPIALVPDNAVHDVPAKSRAKVALFPGEVLLEERITTNDAKGLSPGMVALTMPVVARVPLVEERDLVDLWLVDSANFSSHRVARNVVVLAFSDRDITVAVAADQVAAATVASLRPVTVALVG